MGSGKTSWAIEYMRSHPEEKFLYVTPYITEIIRILNEVRGAKEPTNKNCSKAEDLKRLLTENRNIILCTHELFIRFDREIRELVITGGYTIIMDEALQAISPYQSSWHRHPPDSDPYTTFDDDNDNIVYLQSKCSIEVDDEDYILWTDDEADSLHLREPFYKEIRKLALDHRLIYVHQRYPVVVYPHDIFLECKKAYIMTYLFEASIMYYYFRIFKINYLKKSISKINGQYQLVEFYMPDTSIYQRLIEIVDNSVFRSKLRVSNTALSSTWSKNARRNNEAGKTLKRIQCNFINCINNRWNTNESSQNLLWTCIGKNAKNLLSRKGIVNCFESVNCRGTNNYINVKYMGYFANIYMNVSVKKYIESKNLQVNENSYALCEMLQFIWRGCIRRGDLLTIYIPSPRMRKLLCEWLGVAFIPEPKKITMLKANKALS